MPQLILLGNHPLADGPVGYTCPSNDFSVTCPPPSPSTYLRFRAPAARCLCYGLSIAYSDFIPKLPSFLPLGRCCVAEG